MKNPETTNTPAPAAAQTETATAGQHPAAGTAAPATSEPPVDMARLNDFTNGNQDELRDLINLYLKQTTTQVEQLAAAVKAGSAPDVRRVSHSCAGASATCGMNQIVVFLRQLEHESEAGNLSNAPELSRKVEEEFKRIRAFLEAQLPQSALAPQS